MSIKHYVEVHAPMDQVFVGPFRDAGAATQYAKGLRAKRGFNCYPLDEAQMRASVEEWGVLPVQTPERD